MHPISREMSSSINTLNSLLLNHNPTINNSINSHFDNNNEFLEQILSSSFPTCSAHQLEAQSEPSQHQISNDNNAADLMQHQLSLLSRGLVHHGLLPDHHNDGYSFASQQANDAPVKALFNGSMGQPSNQHHQFHNPEGGAINKPAASGSSRGGTGAQPRPRVRARRGQATDPHSIAERLRRERIAERMKGLQELVPNANKTDKASMLDEIIDYVKFLQLQVKVLSLSRLGGAVPLVADISSEGRTTNNTMQMLSSPNNDDGIMVTEQHVVKLMEEDMRSAMQYLQSKGLCLMPISLANAISTSTCQTTKNPFNTNGNTSNNPLLHDELGVYNSQSMSGLHVQSATIAGTAVEDTLPSKT